VRRTALIAFALALIGAGAFALAASGGGTGRALDVSRTAKAPSVHYTVAVTLNHRHQPLTLHIVGAAARDKAVAHLSLGLADARLMRSPAFLYEGGPHSILSFGGIDWLRLRVDRLSPHAQIFSMLRAVTPSPLLRVVAEAKLHPAGATGVFTGPVAYDDPVVRTALYQLTAGFEFRGLSLRIVVGRDGLIHRFLLTGHTADRSTTLTLRAHLFGFGEPVRVEPPKPGTFMDPDLVKLKS